MPGETDLYGALCTALERELGDDYECRYGESLAYDLRYDASDAVGEQTFQADVAVFADGVPRLVVGVTAGDPTTHQLVVYDDKARRHKQTRPFLRYGLAAFGADGGVTKADLWHTDAIDFLFASAGTPAEVAGDSGRESGVSEDGGGSDPPGASVGPDDGRSGDSDDDRFGLPDDGLSTLVHLVRRNLEASHRLERVLEGHSGHVAMNRDVQFYDSDRGIGAVESPIPPGE